jgi:hypothetical protein
MTLFATKAYGVRHTRHVWTPIEQERFKPQGLAFVSRPHHHRNAN